MESSRRNWLYRQWPRCYSALEHKEDAQQMADLPSGTVTFLFTDVEGSTKMWERYPPSSAHAG
jgi:class 3 adenylate cyclase